jgi:hypothetical protein
VPETVPFEYAIVRVVPFVERGECINAGVILLCRAHKFLQARVELDEKRLHALAEGIDLPAIQAQLDTIVEMCAGHGPLGHLTPVERFRWLVSPRSTSVQVSEVHCGLCHDPAATLEHLLDTMVRVTRTASP